MAIKVTKPNGSKTHINSPIVNDVSNSPVVFSTDVSWKDIQSAITEWNANGGLTTEFIITKLEELWNSVYDAQNGILVRLAALEQGSSIVPVEGILINSASITLSSVGATQTLTATVTPSNATNKVVTWSSSNESVATVDNNGKVTAVAPGSATITATAQGDTSKKATCNVICDWQTNIPVEGISINSTSIRLTSAGATQTLTATVTPANASNKVVTWSSSNSNIVTVDSNGKVTAVTPGSATITATAQGDTSKKATCNVTCSWQEEPEVYYWYAGQFQPISQSSVTAQDSGAFTNNNWHTIDINNTYTFGNPIYNSESNPILGDNKTNWYVALPADKSYGIYDSDDVNEVTAGNITKVSTITVANVTYNIYKTVGTYRNFNGWWIH